MEIKMGINEIAARLFSLVPKLNEKEQLISLRLYRILARGEPVSHEQLARELDLSQEIVEQFLKDRLGVYYDDNQNIIGYVGLAITEMPHRFILEGRTLYTWCAWDSLFIPALLGANAKVQSISPDTGESISFTASPDGVKDVIPESATMSVLIPDEKNEKYKDELQKDIIGSFCHFVFFFESYTAGSEWISRRTEKFAQLSIEEAFRLGQKFNDYVYNSASA